MAMKKLLFTLLTLMVAALLLTACGAGNAQSGIEVRQRWWILVHKAKIARFIWGCLIMTLKRIN